MQMAHQASRKAISRYVGLDSAYRADQVGVLLDL